MASTHQHVFYERNGTDGSLCDNHQSAQSASVYDIGILPISSSTFFTPSTATIVIFPESSALTSAQNCSKLYPYPISDIRLGTANLASPHLLVKWTRLPYSSGMLGSSVRRSGVGSQRVEMDVCRRGLRVLWSME